MQRIKSSHFLAGLIAAILFALTACQCDESQLPNKTWVLEKYGPESALQAAIPGTPPAKAEITLQLDGNGHFSGNDGCNLIGGVYTLGGNCQIKFDSIHTTLMMCQDSIMKQAGVINNLFAKVNRYKVDEGKLELCTPDKEVLQYRKK